MFSSISKGVFFVHAVCIWESLYLIDSSKIKDFYLVNKDFFKKKSCGLRLGKLYFQWCTSRRFWHIFRAVLRFWYWVCEVHDPFEVSSGLLLLIKYYYRGKRCSATNKRRYILVGKHQCTWLSHFTPPQVHKGHFVDHCCCLFCVMLFSLH